MMELRALQYVLPVTRQERITQAATYLHSA